MNNKIVKTIDEHNIDRDANVMFAFDLEGSEYVSYRISRDEEQDNLFISKILKNLDGTFNMVNIDDTNEKTKLNSIVTSLVGSAVKSSADKLPGDTVSLSDGKTIKFISVAFNKEQKIEVRKTYVTTVKKEVSRVAEKYYDVVVVKEEPKVVEDIFPTVIPVAEVVQEVAKPVEVVASDPVVASIPVVESPVLSTPVIEVPNVQQQVVVAATPVVNTQVVQPSVSVQSVAPVVETISTSQPVVNVTTPATEVVVPVQEASIIHQPTVVVSQPAVILESVPAALPTETQPLIFDASKETNLNAALGEVASAETIPVENIAPVREFGVEAPVQTVISTQPIVAPMVQSEVVSEPKKLTKKAGFANSKFFMLVAIAFFLASCIFLGYEVFNYFQLTK